MLSAYDGWGVAAMRARLEPGRTTALLGMSGVGKSTLVNLLLGEERQRTLAVREGDARGRHATTHRELFVLDDGALLLDTPGLRLPRMATAEGVEDAFADVVAAAARCRFADCRTRASRAARCGRRSRPASWTRSAWRRCASSSARA